MDDKIIILILTVIIIILGAAVAITYFNGTSMETEYEFYTVNGTGTTMEIPANSEIDDSKDMINITKGDINILIYKNTTKSKSSVTDNSDIVDEKLNKDTKELVKVSCPDEKVRKHIMKSIEFGDAINEDENKTTETANVEVDHSKDPVYCAICGAYVATQYEIDHAPGAGYFIDPSTGKTICDNCAEKQIEEENAQIEDYGPGLQEDGTYIDADGYCWPSYEDYVEYLESESYY